MTEERITRSNWEDSYKKWLEAVTLTRKRVLFNSSIGFADLQIVGSCGYCSQFNGVKKKCKNHCPLFKKRICRSNMLTGFNTVFWQYVRKMKKSAKHPYLVDWDEAQGLATKILEAIKEDEPPK